MADDIKRFDDVDWTKCFHSDTGSFIKAAPGSDESRANWDARAPKFAHKKKRSDYISKLIGHLDLAEGETVFDMGCGSGTLAIPLAKEGHDVVAVDFSPVMLEELEKAAEEEGVASKIDVHNRSWQQDFSDLPTADVAVSSRSFVVSDLADGIAKLESRANDRVFLSIGAGDRPYHDKQIYEAMGLEEVASIPPRELACIANYLWSINRLPRIDYIEYAGVWHHDTRDELVESIKKTHVAQNPSQEAALDAYLDEHVVFNEKEGWWTLDHDRIDRWAVISWSVPIR